MNCRLNKAGILVGMSVIVLISACSRRASDQPRDARRFTTIRIVTTNDIHGALEPTLSPELVVSPETGETGVLGGVDYLAAMIHRIRQEAPERTVVVDAGDCSQGDYAVNASEGQFCSRFFNTAGYTVRTIGNHEFDYLDAGADDPLIDPRGAMKQAAALAGQPIVLANARLADGSPLTPQFKEYVVTDIAGVKVGFTGLLTPTTPTVSRRAGSEGVLFEEPVDALRRVLPRMRADGAGVVVVLTHLTGLCPGRSDDWDGLDTPPCSLNGELAAIQQAFTTADIDLIVSGHDHVRLAGDGPNIPVVENQGQGVSLGLAEIDVDHSTGRAAGRARVLPHVPVCPAHVIGSKVCDRAWPGFTGAVGPDSAVAAVRESVEALVAAECSDVVATAIGNIVYFRGTEPPLANLAADLLRELGTVTLPDGSVVSADVAFMNRGSSRGSLAAGPVTVCDIARVWPFTDPPVLVRLTGAELVRMLTFLIDDVDKAPVISGITVSRTGGDPIAVRDASGNTIDPARVYRVVTTQYLKEGGDRMDEFFRDIPADRWEPLPFKSYRDGFVKLLRERKQVAPPADLRYSGVTRE
ncbi:MAG TPA: 5'-nucleotidase C-terminal domain-containing protein [Myxococcota bacterium]|nr:bifunctional metallophosphatase/5'-nucleotidase [Myxococcota bacterium]HNZ02834.1 5'-nucleotidase C-terminal domain-containing protein [Myxococcota bacterium]HOD06759.1 5'-nucleotidase C-terminal domain-containing protein [Myxococcota bacterium]HPB49928.1 5'-nucleotidase C-terminal domain-containing protein [Myxococcota bacterium]HQP96119.1 5'-nucleotidase C-terminal domain-containing protein [Myxococcota bacterium]